MKREILLLCEYPTLNGGERSMLATLPRLRTTGFSPTVMCPGDGPLAETLRGSAIETIPLECRTADGARRPQSRLREELGRVIRARRHDLLHANSLAMGRLSGPVAAELRMPSIAHLRDIVTLSARAVADLNGHTRLLAVSNSVRNFHLAQGLAAEKTHVLYNGVDLQDFRPRPATGWLHRQLGIPDDSMLIGTIGQLGLRKGQDVLLRAAQSLADRLPQVHYVLIGERHSNKDESRQYEQQLHAAAEGALTGRVHFLGHRDDVPRLLSELTLLVHPARQEPLGRVLLEAAAAGLAVIATNVGGTPEIFPPGENAARLVPAGNADALAEAILSLAGDAVARNLLGTAARRRAERYFNIQTAVDGLAQHYRAVIQEFKPGATAVC